MADFFEKVLHFKVYVLAVYTEFFGSVGNSEAKLYRGGILPNAVIIKFPCIELAIDFRWALSDPFNGSGIGQWSNVYKLLNYSKSREPMYK